MTVDRAALEQAVVFTEMAMTRAKEAWAQAERADGAAQEAARLSWIAMDAAQARIGSLSPGGTPPSPPG